MIYQLGYSIPSVWTHPYLIYTLHRSVGESFQAGHGQRESPCADTSRTRSSLPALCGLPGLSACFSLQFWSRPGLSPRSPGSFQCRVGIRNKDLNPGWAWAAGAGFCFLPHCLPLSVHYLPSLSSVFFLFKMKVLLL